MHYDKNSPSENATPDPEFLITSIAEQGYSLETSLADLIDNSITSGADKIEVLVDTDTEPFMLFIADNGSGMSEASLKQNMQFPSSSSQEIRKAGDLGRFGLGMKTASFSQSRSFTVLSREKGTKDFHARTWDVDYLKKQKEWKIIVNTEAEVAGMLKLYTKLSEGFFSSYDDYVPNTIVVWRGLYKFEKYLDNNKQKALQTEITEITSEYLSLVFHRFLERKERPVSIRINNNIISPFNPFPDNQPEFRRLESNYKQFRSDNLKIEGYVLPVRSMEESKKGNSVWTLQSKSLMDMEGIYIYRANRIILYGGWNGIIKKSPRLQLARLKVDIGNGVDHLFHLNVAKSSIIIPYELRHAFLRYVSELRTEAEKEYFNHGVRKASARKKSADQAFFARRPSSKGMLYELNEDFPLVKALKDQVTAEQFRLFRIIARMVNTTINSIRQVHEDADFTSAKNNMLSTEELAASVRLLKEIGLSGEQIRESVLSILGLRMDTIPEDIMKLVK